MKRRKEQPMANTIHGNWRYITLAIFLALGSGYLFLKQGTLTSKLVPNSSEKEQKVSASGPDRQPQNTTRLPAPAARKVSPTQIARLSTLNEKEVENEIAELNTNYFTDENIALLNSADATQQYRDLIEEKLELKNALNKRQMDLKLQDIQARIAKLEMEQPDRIQNLQKAFDSAVDN